MGNGGLGHRCECGLRCPAADTGRIGWWISHGSQVRIDMLGATASVSISWIVYSSNRIVGH
jgi:hypothetical protein